MSDAYLRYISTDPSFRPSEDAIASALGLLRSMFPEAQDVTCRSMSDVSFIDAGSNWEGVCCSSCGADAEDWWSRAMTSAGEAGFSDLTVTAPCCGATLSLNDLAYRWPVGFAVVVFEVANANSFGLGPEQLLQVGAALGSPVREIPAHY